MIAVPEIMVDDPVWKSVIGYEGHYEVSSNGEVRSLDRFLLRNNLRSLFIAGRTLKKDRNINGYYIVKLAIDGKAKTWTVHRLVLTVFVGPQPQNCVCRHLDGIRTNNNVSNLRWGTQVENCEDSYQHGVLPVGERHHACKLSDNDVAAIRKRYSEGGITQQKLADEYGVSDSNISGMISGKRRRRPTNPESRTEGISDEQ